VKGLKTRRALWRENADREHTLYRLFDPEDNLLYVGITFMPGHRLETHRRERYWWPDVVRTEFETFQDRKSAQAAERLAIRSEHPRYNLQNRVF
jgi:predicted GIY-YIG superfamily endonuclease